MSSEVERLFYDTRPPRAGTVLMQSVTAAAVIDLSSAGKYYFAESMAYNGSIESAVRSEAVSIAGGGTQAQPTTLQPSGYVGHFIDVFSDGADTGIITGPTSASVSGANAPVLATTGNSGTAGVCMRINAGQTKRYFITADDRFMGVVSSATTLLRIALSSR
jgi:hypothetical protein